MSLNVDQNEKWSRLELIKTCYWLAVITLFFLVATFLTDSFCFSYRERSCLVFYYIIKTHFCGSVWSLKSLFVAVNVFYIFFCDKKISEKNSFTKTCTLILIQLVMFVTYHTIDNSYLKIPVKINRRYFSLY